MKSKINLKRLKVKLNKIRHDAANECGYDNWNEYNNSFNNINIFKLKKLYYTYKIKISNGWKRNKKKIY